MGKDVGMDVQVNDTLTHNVPQWDVDGLCKQDRTPNSSSATHWLCGAEQDTQVSDIQFPKL